MSEEEQQLIDKLINERIEYQTAIDDKKRMEEDLASAIMTLSNTTTANMRNNIALISQDYTLLIGQINSAIQAQRTLNALRASGGGVEQRYAG